MLTNYPPIINKTDYVALKCAKNNPYQSRNSEKFYLKIYLFFIQLWAYISADPVSVALTIFPATKPALSAGGWRIIFLGKVFPEEDLVG
jgi:hypothetical protein